jgi:hypothetical protein
VPTTYNFNVGIQKKLPGGVIWDIAYVGSIANHLPRQVNLNAVPYGARFLPENQDPTLPASTLPGQNAYDSNFLRPYQGYATSTFACMTPIRTTTGCRRRSIADSRTACSLPPTTRSARRSTRRP